MRKTTLRAIAILITSVTVLSSCGWQLRGAKAQRAELGSISLLEEIKLTSESGTRLLARAVKRELKHQKIAQTPQSKVRLTLSSEKVEKRPLAYGSTGVPVQYKLIMSVRYSFSDATSTQLPLELISRRNFDFDTELIVAKNEEEQRLLQEMREELARRILSSYSQ